jgi:hypothetical protein
MKSFIAFIILLLSTDISFAAGDAVRVSGDLKVNGVHFSDGSTMSSANDMLKNKGTWVSGNLYSAGDVVQNNGISYVCKTANQDQLLSNATYWSVLSTQGPKGDTGPQAQITLTSICAAISAENAQLPSFCFISSYLPLQVGNKWIYTSLVQGQYRNDEIIGSEAIYGTTTYIKQRLEPSPDNYQEKQWLAYDISSLLLYRIWGNEGADPAVDLSPPAVLNKVAPQVGNSWSWGVPNMFTGNIEVVSINDTVTVPAGTFYRCLKTKETQVPSGKIKITHYAPGVGMIRYENQGSWVEELVYAKVGSKTYGVTP